MHKFEKLANSFTGQDLFLWLDSIPRSMRKTAIIRTQRHPNSLCHKLSLVDLAKIIPGLNVNQAMINIGGTKISEDVGGFASAKKSILACAKLLTSELLSVVSDPTNENTAFEVVKSLEDLHSLLYKLDSLHLKDMSVCGINLDLDGKTAIFINSSSLTFNVAYGGLEAAIDYSKLKG